MAVKVIELEPLRVAHRGTKVHERLPVPPRPVRAAIVMSWAIAGLMVAAAAWGLLAPGLYHEGAWAREALRGGDVVTLFVAAPLLVVSLLMTMRGSRWAIPVWIGLLAYSIYNYAFYAFGAAFNDAFLLHIVLLSLSVYAMAFALAGIDVAAVAARFRGVRGPRAAGLFLVIVGALQGALWVFVVVRNAITGELIHDVPIAGQHLVFALDLGLAMPALVLGGWLLFRHRPFGFVLGIAMAVMGALYQLNLMAAGVFQAHANVAGVTAFAPESVVLTAAFAVVAVVLLLPRRSRETPLPVDR